MINKMKALRFSSSLQNNLNPLRIESAEIPVPNKNEVLIKVHTCSICHTDLHVIEGELLAKKSPLIPGHHVVGKVGKTGRKENLLRILWKKYY